MRVYDRLTLICLTPPQHSQTLGYWYTVQSFGMPYTAFRTRAALEFFLDAHRLKLGTPLPDQTGTHAFINIEGAIREMMHLDITEMPAQGRRVLKMSNAQYTLGIIEEDDAGTILHFVNPNKKRITFNPTDARAHEDAGHKGPLELYK